MNLKDLGNVPSGTTGDISNNGSDKTGLRLSGRQERHLLTPLYRSNDATFTYS